MIEPPIPGFTGVIWAARPAEKLAHDLATGPGVRPMAEAGAAWSRLAAVFGAAVIEYDQIMARMRDSWRSTESGPAIDRFAALRHWLADTAAAAGRNASLAGGQAVAYEVASLAMPHLDDLAALTAAARSLEQVGAALGAPLVATVADTAAEQDLTKASAARVMHGYESASASLAAPWQHVQPPEIVSSTAWEAERSTAPPVSGAVPAATMGAGFGIPRVPRPLSPYRTGASTPLVAAAPEAVPVQSSPAAAPSEAGRMVPAGMAPPSALAGADRAVRAGVIDEETGAVMEIDTGIQAAPPVLGAAETSCHPVPGTGTS
ncbi:PPE domain-containing protein [Nocardia fusca]|uniref:PPE domain-containing protein n=1 Tax=Nocardia fusca TaxID=941183 RepID=UPI0007A74922|nr:PPE domain-containing protein [Nocardia fusca]